MVQTVRNCIHKCILVFVPLLPPFPSKYPRFFDAVSLYFEAIYKDTLLSVLTLERESLVHGSFIISRVTECLDDVKLIFPP